MKGAEVHKLSDAELGSELARLRNDLFDMRAKSVTEKVDDVSKYGKMRKDIARLLTIQRARELGNESAPKPKRRAPKAHRHAEHAKKKVAKKASHHAAKKAAKHAAKKKVGGRTSKKAATPKPKSERHSARKKKGVTKKAARAGGTGAKKTGHQKAARKAGGHKTAKKA